ncbi:molybdopterin molybdotransferase [Filimonas zeae]|uniref:Molybdopterin molybdenumtransferase n=1 Tax=Filimonas zeae TaxID=1737353 RepID=A0A917MWU1_9BACT|nr:gephyrin-like molybdotransferase Glp [Filimonas zeae]MDR6340289.1 molybdopterin molybdotransferase [Filimonas zeae]GGH72031.1 molybdopterin molybdenumtransferase MoeA [Filimonas zeae]
MVSVTAAKKNIQELAAPVPYETVPLSEASGRVLALPVHAPADVPGFHQSAMDGYAFTWQCWQQLPLEVHGRIPAGFAEQEPLSPQYAVRIYTGAALPPGADTVVMQEKTVLHQARLFIQDERLAPGANVRLRGSEVAAGQLALEAGSYLHSGSVGFLANMGVYEVPVHRKVRVTLIITGSELVQPGAPLLYGQVYEANSWSLRAALQHLPVQVQQVLHVPDNLHQTIQAINTAVIQSDVVLITGGVSTGDYDYVAEALHACGTQFLFHKVKQKPGKPLLFARSGQTLLFGLPGNPAAVLTCFYEYVWPAIEQMAGLCNTRLQQVQRRLTARVVKKPGLTCFMKAICNTEEVTPCMAQESYRLSSFHTANCLLVLEEDTTAYSPGDLVKVHLLPDRLPY